MRFFVSFRSRYPNQPISRRAGVAPDGFTGTDVRASRIIGSIVIRSHYSKAYHRRFGANDSDISWPFTGITASCARSAPYRHLLAVLVAVLPLGLMSCNSLHAQYDVPPVTHRGEAGGVLLSVNGVSRWEQVADAMQPKFSLPSGDAALAKVMPVTARLEKQILDAFGVSLGVGLAQRRRDSTATQDSTSSQASASASTTATPAATPSGTPAGAEMPARNENRAELGVDPIMQYRAAASLYQAIQLMNREVELAAQRRGYVPYLVRMQLAYVPYRRDVPYDVHAQMEFFPTDETLSIRKALESDALPYVIPLVATDNLEQAVKTRAAEVARQISLGLGVGTPEIGLNAGVNSQNRNRDSAYGADISSLFTVTRLNDNGIYIRLGAANGASGKSLVGRTYDIALLLLVPEAYFRKQESRASNGSGTDNTVIKEIDDAGNRRSNAGNGTQRKLPPAPTPVTGSDRAVKLSVITHTDLRDASTGAILQERDREKLIAQIDSAMARTLAGRHSDMHETWLRSPDTFRYRVGDSLIGAINRSDYAGFEKAARAYVLVPKAKEGEIIKTSGELSSVECGDEVSEPEETGYRLGCISGGYLRSLWTYLAATIVERSTQSASIELPRPVEIRIPRQTALLRDDGKETVDVVLRDVYGASPGTVAAKLVLVNGTGARYEFAAEGVVPDATLRTLTLRFPSPAKWSAGTVDYAKSRLVVERVGCDTGPTCPDARIEGPFMLLHAPAKSNGAGPGFDMRASASAIVAGNGAGSVTLVFDNFRDDSAVLTWSGADVRSAKKVGGGAMDIALNRITLKSAASLVLDVLNLQPDRKVTFRAVGFRKNQRTGEASSELAVVAVK
jgi:hypothetical protein